MLSVEFESVERRVPDLVSRLDDGRIFHLDVQSDNDPRMARRMLRYWLPLSERYEDIPIVQHVLFIGDSKCTMPSKIEKDLISYGYELTDIRQMDKEVFLTSKSNFQRALAILSRVRNERETVRRILAS